MFCFLPVDTAMAVFAQPRSFKSKRRIFDYDSGSHCPHRHRVLVIVVLIKGAVIVPQKSAFIIERLGKFDRSLEAGFHILIPFVDRRAYVFSLKLGFLRGRQTQS